MEYKRSIACNSAFLCFVFAQPTDAIGACMVSQGTHPVGLRKQNDRYSPTISMPFQCRPNEANREDVASFHTRTNICPALADLSNEKDRDILARKSPGIK